jgi:ectoine hydroxylase-related dioxygenase (phytanoyl-CoA dioxygenase family)
MIQQDILENGFAIAKDIFTEKEVNMILQYIDNQKETNNNFKFNNDLFAIRCVLNELPDLKKWIVNDRLKALIASFGKGYFIVKSIYFDKPIKANWVVNAHQDLTISVKNKTPVEGFTHWLPKENYFSVQPPQSYLENILTIRIHLDDCTKDNGALRVVPKSHHKIMDFRTLNNDFFDNEIICAIPKGGVLLMKPLIWHSSRRTENQQKRRVIHIELSNLALPEPLIWAEFSELNH